jgi:predicted nucleic acid-binding protein
VVNCYLDASALAKRYVAETGTALMDHLWTRVPPHCLVALNVGVAEGAWVIVRKRNTGNLSAAAYAQAMSEYYADVINSMAFNKLEVNNALTGAAIPLIETHSINAADAILLRSALDLSAAMRANGDDLVLVSADGRLLKAAAAEGLTTFNPETQTQQELDALIGP